jgi:hypothetical protein
MIYTLIFICISFIFKAIADTLKFHWSNSIFSKIKNNKINQWLNPNSWTLMYKNGDYKQGEKFWGSSRWFAFLTDGWHLFILIQIFSMLLAITFNIYYIPYISKFIDAFLLYCIGGFLFEFLFSKIFKVK